MNTIMRSIGGAIGGQITASVLAGSIVAASGLPTDDAFTFAFAISAGGLLLAVGAATMIPRRVAAAPAAAAAPVAEAA